MTEVERTSLCNCVVNFLLEENYLLTAFELLHELLDDGRDHLAIRLKEFFSNPALFAPDQISRFNTLRPMDPQSLLEEKEAVEEKLALCEYELRLAREDVVKLKSAFHNNAELPPDNLTESDAGSSLSQLDIQQQKKDGTFSDLGPLKSHERRDLDFAVKEYLLMAGYRLSAMTFYEEASDKDVDVFENSPAQVHDALRNYYYAYLSSTTEAAGEKIAMIQDNERLKCEKETSVKDKDLADIQIGILTKSLEARQNDIKEKEKLVEDLKQVSEHQRKELTDSRAMFAALKISVKESSSGENVVASNIDLAQVPALEICGQEAKPVLFGSGNLTHPDNNGAIDAIFPEKYSFHNEEIVFETVFVQPVDLDQSNLVGKPFIKDVQSLASKTTDDVVTPEGLQLPVITANNNPSLSGRAKESKQDETPLMGKNEQHATSDRFTEADSQKQGLGTIQVLADCLPKIVPHVLINYRAEVLPLIMCAIERHPDSSTCDLLTHTLFNLILRPNEKQRRIIMDACVSLAKNVGKMRTETVLLPLCWEQMNDDHEERRLLVAQSCGELAEFVRPEIRDSLILSILQQLVEDSSSVVRVAAAHNLALLLPLFSNMEKYFKVEELMFQLACDPSGVVVETTFRELLPSLIAWGNKLDNILRVLMSHMLSCAQRCPSLSGDEGAVESHLHILGERERRSIDAFLQMLVELLPYLHQKSIEMCPFASISGSDGNIFSDVLLELYAGGHVEWPAFEWMHMDCFPDLIKFACLLPQKEDSLRNRITKFLLAVAESFGDSYLTHIMVPVFSIAVGENADLTFFPSNIHPRIKGLKPKSYMAERLATLCVLPLHLAGVLGASHKHGQLGDYLKKLVVEGILKENQSRSRFTEILNAVRFLCIFREHHGMIINLLWEMVVSFDVALKIGAANLLEVIVPYVDAKVASTHVLPALVTLGSDQDLDVKYATIDAFGAVAQHFRDDMIVEKIRVQMDVFLEDGSHETTIAVVRALVIAVPHTSDKLKDYLLSKIFQLTGMTFSTNDVMYCRQRANSFCEAIRALDATDISANGNRNLLLPAIQNLLRDPDALDPAHKEALEIIMKERSGGTVDMSKVTGVGAHLGLPSSVSSFFGEGGLLGKREAVSEQSHSPAESPRATSAAPVEDTRFKRIMRGNFKEMLRGKGKTQELGQ